jgi:hypothetical protein
MSVQEKENYRDRAMRAFLIWVKNAVDAGVPVFSQQGEKVELSPPLKNISSALRIFGLSDQDLIDLAQAGETAAKLEIALKNKATEQRVKELRTAYHEIWERFSTKKWSLCKNMD